MFAIIRVGGKQYRVENGTQLLVDRLHVEEGAPVEGVEVLMVVDGDDTRIGTPTLEVPVGVTALRHTLGKKIRVFKYKAKKNYRRRIGSRPHHTLIRIDSIDGNSTHNQPAQATQTAPVETVAPAETVKTVAATPADTSTVETAPVDIAPVETAAVETEPVETAAVETEPVAVAIVETPAVALVETTVETPVAVPLDESTIGVAVVETPVVAEVPVTVETPVVIEAPVEEK